MTSRVAVLALLFVPPLTAQNSGLDDRLFRSINGAQNPARNGFFEYLDYSSLPTFAALPIGFLVVGAAGNNGSAALTGSMTGIGQVTALGLTMILKETIARPRPFETLQNVHVKHRWSASGHSFPSGHTSQAFAIASVISLRYQKATITIPMFLWAASVGVGRVYLGVHYPSDVLGGMILGVGSGLIAWSLRKEIAGFSKNIAAPQETNGLVIPHSTLIDMRIPLKSLRIASAG